MLNRSFGTYFAPLEREVDRPVEFSEGEETGVGGDRRTSEMHLDAGVGSEPKGSILTYTYRVKPPKRGYSSSTPRLGANPVPWKRVT